MLSFLPVCPIGQALASTGNHSLHTIATKNIDAASCPDDGVAARANISAAVAFCSVNWQASISGGISPYNANTIKVVAIKFDFLNVIIQNPFK